MSAPLRDDPRSDSFEVSLDDMLERVSASSREDQVTRTSPAPVSQARVPRQAPLASLATLAERAKPGNESAMRRVALPVLVVLAFAATAFLVTSRRLIREAPPVAYERLPAPSAGHAPVARAAPAWVDRKMMPAISTDGDASTEALMLDQLAGPTAGAATSTRSLGADPSAAYAIARYDTLQSRASDWQVLAPLGVEEVYALVPIQSSLKSLADLRGRRINVGASGSARSRSGRALYSAMFGRSLPPSELTSAPREVALASLLRGDSLDALIVFDGQPSRWLATLPAATLQQLRLLKFEPDGAVGRRALQRYLPVALEPLSTQGDGPVPTLGEVTFLVGKVQAADAGAVLETLCQRLPALQARGHPKWREVDLSLRLPLDLQRSPDLDKALHACEESVPVAPAFPS